MFLLFSLRFISYIFDSIFYLTEKQQGSTIRFFFFFLFNQWTRTSLISAIVYFLPRHCCGCHTCIGIRTQCWYISTIGFGACQVSNSISRLRNLKPLLRNRNIRRANERSPVERSLRSPSGWWFINVVSPLIDPIFKIGNDQLSAAKNNRPPSDKSTR